MTSHKETGDETMTATRKIEIFSAGCPVCVATVTGVRELACESCEIAVLDMRDAGVAERARALGVGSLPAVAMEGRLADCRAGRGPDEDALRAAGLGQPLN